MAFQTDKKKVSKKVAEAISEPIKEVKEKSVEEQLIRLIQSVENTSTTSTVVSPTNRSVKISVANYELLKRYAFENNRKLKDVLDQIIIDYITANLDDFAKTAQPAIEAINRKREESKEEIQAKIERLQKQLEDGGE